MGAAGVATAAYQVVTGVEEGMAAIGGSYPAVLKADGLAAGKGVVIAADAAVARATLEDLLVAHRFDTERVVIEEHLTGYELSLLALCDGERAVPLASAQDFKRIGDGDRGPNTGGMGSYSPVPAVDEQFAAEICATVHQPVVDELARRGTPFSGVLYAGLMVTAGQGRAGSESLSSTSASAIRRRRRSCRGCGPTCWSCSRRARCPVGCRIWRRCSGIRARP